MAAKSKAKPALRAGGGQPTRADVEKAVAQPTAGVPPWLNIMRAITGLTETPGSESNPKIIAMSNYIGNKYEDMASYAAIYQDDATAWCGLTAAFCCAVSDIRPPFGPTDTDKYLWAQSFGDDPGFIKTDQPRLGTIVVMTRSGGGHVTFFEEDAGSSFKARGGNQSDMVNVATFSKSDVIGWMWPKDAPLPPAERPMLEEGDTGTAVVELQTVLGLPPDGEFGPMTENAVESFQAACDLEIDGVVGPDTWAAVDDLDHKMTEGDDGLPTEMVRDIEELAHNSDLMEYEWPSRGRMPEGYLPGMALCFGLACKLYLDNVSFITPMAQADRNAPDTDVLSWYKAEFLNLGMSNATAGLDTLRHLFALMIALGPRESSGRYCEGRDMSASNVQADTAEAGLFQTSWNINTANPEIKKILDLYWADPNGYRFVFEEGVTPTAANWDGYGTGTGARYQWLAKYSPAFATFVTAVGLRLRRQHWGPVNRRELDTTTFTKSDILLREVQEVIEAGEIEPVPPEPQPEPPDAVVSINVAASGPVKVTINGQTIIEPE